MLEERLILLFAYLLVASLLLLVCFRTNFTKKSKSLFVLVVTVFYFVTWQGLFDILGWPTYEELPDKFKISWVVIQEPNKISKKEGGLYLWVRNLDESNRPFGQPRAYSLFWNEENHRRAQEALHRIKEGEQLNGRKTYGVLNKDNKGEKSNKYESEETIQEEGVPSFVFDEVPPPDLPAKTTILE